MWSLQVVYALVTEADAFRFPYLLQPDNVPSMAQTKRLQNASAVTDSNGVANFTSLGFEVCPSSHWRLRGGDAPLWRCRDSLRSAVFTSCLP